MVAAASLILLMLTGNAVRPSLEQMQRRVEDAILRCEAQHLISVSVSYDGDNTVFEIESVKDPNQRTESDLLALRCLGRQNTYAIDFREIAETLLTLKASNAQTH